MMTVAQLLHSGFLTNETVIWNVSGTFISNSGHQETKTINKFHKVNIIW